MAITRVSTQGLTRSGTAIADVPDIPSIGAISDPGTDGYATVAFTAAATGGSASSYIATSTPDSITGSSSTSPITVTGLTLGTSYTFKVKGSNSTATGAESSASSSFTPIAHWAPAGAYDSIATVTVGSTPQSSITFSSIPSTYQHLQIRAMVRQTASANYVATFNSDGGGNYSTHRLMGDGSNASAAAFAPVGAMYVGFIPNASFPGSIVMDIFNYSNTNTYKTIRALEGSDVNGATGYVTFWSGNWRNTNAVNTITLTPLSTTFAEYSSFALYGIKGN